MSGSMPESAKSSSNGISSSLPPWCFFSCLPRQNCYQECCSKAVKAIRLKSHTLRRSRCAKVTSRVRSGFLQDGRFRLTFSSLFVDAICISMVNLFVCGSGTRRTNPITEGVIRLTRVVLQPGESQEHLLKRFRTAVQKARVLPDARRKRWFVSKSELKRIKRQKAIRRARRRQRKLARKM